MIRWVTWMGWMLNRRCSSFIIGWRGGTLKATKKMIIQMISNSLNSLMCISWLKRSDKKYSRKNSKSRIRNSLLRKSIRSLMRSRKFKQEMSKLKRNSINFLMMKIQSSKHTDWIITGILQILFPFNSINQGGYGKMALEELRSKERMK